MHVKHMPQTVLEERIARRMEIATHEEGGVLTALAVDLAKWFQQNDKRFDRVAFLTACGCFSRYLKDYT